MLETELIQLRAQLATIKQPLSPVSVDKDQNTPLSAKPKPEKGNNLLCI
jgi:hypothetical protein